MGLCLLVQVVIQEDQLVLVQVVSRRVNVQVPGVLLVDVDQVLLGM